MKMKCLRGHAHKNKTLPHKNANSITKVLEFMDCSTLSTLLQSRELITHVFSPRYKSAIFNEVSMTRSTAHKFSERKSDAKTRGLPNLYYQSSFP